MPIYTRCGVEPVGRCSDQTGSLFRPASFEAQRCTRLEVVLRCKESTGAD